MSELVLGSVVTYKNNYYIALGYDGHLVKILAPNQGNRKLQVKRSNVTVVDTPPATVVPHNGSEYLVTAKGTIVSCTTGRVMKWGDENGDRKEILRRCHLMITVPKPVIEAYKLYRANLPKKATRFQSLERFHASYQGATS